MFASLLGPALLPAATAHARDASVRAFAIPAKPINDALIDLAIQAGISIGGAKVCHGPGAAVNGAMTVDEALRRILARSDCDFVHAGQQTIRIISAGPKPRPNRPAARPDREPQPVAPLAEVVVTATKRPLASSQVPAAVSSIAGAQLRQSDITDAGDLSAQLAGVVTTNLGPGRDKILIRGLSDGVFTGRTQSTVGIYLDQVSITYNAPDPDLRLADISAVEVLRGPQGALYGSGNLSGVYRILTNKPQFDRREGAIRAGATNTRSGAPGHDIELMLNSPMAGGRAAVRAVAYREVDGGYIDDLGSSVADIDRTLRFGGRAALLATAGDWTLGLAATFQQIHANDTQYVDAAYGRLHRPNRIREASDNRFRQAVATAEREDAWGTLNASVALINHNYGSRADASNALPIFGQRVPSVAAYDEEVDHRMVVIDGVAASPDHGVWRWLLGVYGSTSEADTRSSVVANPGKAAPGLLLYHEARTDRLDEVAAYGEVSRALTSQLTLAVGGRLSSARVKTSSRVLAPQDGQRRDFTGSQTFKVVTPSMSVKYQMAETATAYGVLSAGRRPGGFNTAGPIGLAFLPVAGRGPSRQFGPDTLWNLEAGLKASGWNHRFRVRAAAFYETWRNIQTDQYLLSGLPYTSNAGDGRNVGIEAEADVQPSERLLLQANMLVNEPRLTDVNAGFAARSGARLPGVPAFSAGGRATYAWPVGHGLLARVNAEAEYIGRSHLTFDPSLSPKMGGYVISRLVTQLSSDRWTLTGAVINPLDASGNTFSYGNPFEFRQTRQVTPQRPRTLQLSIAATF